MSVPCTKQTFRSTSYMSAFDPNRTSRFGATRRKPRRGKTAPSNCLLGVGFSALQRCLIEQNEGKRVAGLGCRVATQARHLSRNAAGVLCDDLAEAIALDRDFLSSFDLVVQLDQMFDEPALSSRSSVGTSASARWEGRAATECGNSGVRELP
jgi:hypothetical protein